jgi:hypothetical protein
MAYRHTINCEARRKWRTRIPPYLRRTDSHSRDDRKEQHLRICSRSPANILVRTQGRRADFGQSRKIVSRTFDTDPFVFTLGGENQVLYRHVHVFSLIVLDV